MTSLMLVLTYFKANESGEKRGHPNSPENAQNDPRKKKQNKTSKLSEHYWSLDSTPERNEVIMKTKYIGKVL